VVTCPLWPRRPLKEESVTLCEMVESLAIRRPACAVLAKASKVQRRGIVVRKVTEQIVFPTVSIEPGNSVGRKL
jgi:hypothetical protein